jgi:hypothetical protein
MNRQLLYNHIGRLLALEYNPEGEDFVKAHFPQNKSQWQTWVKMGSENLVLPAVWHSLLCNRLENYVPDDLQEYLGYVYELNIERNNHIIKLASEVKQILHGMDCIFMKGTGNLLDGLYADAGVRMIYDVDVLVGRHNMLEAAHRLEKQGFHTQKKFNPRAMESTMHYPILLRKDRVAGVEIHAMPVQYLYQEGFDVADIFNLKTFSRDEKGFYVMNYPHRIIHNFIHSQLMHSGHWHGWVSLRDIFDLLLLGQKENLSDTFINYGFYSKQSLAYLRHMYTTFALPLPDKLQDKRFDKTLSKRNKYVLGLNDKRLKWHFITFAALQKYVVLPARVMWNPSARNYVFSRLLDPGWYRLHFNAIMRMLQKPTLKD